MDDFVPLHSLLRVGGLTSVTQFSSVAALTVAEGVASVGDLTAAMFALQPLAGVEELPLLVAQGTTVALLAIAAVGLRIQRNTLPMNTPVQK